MWLVKMRSFWTSAAPNLIWLECLYKGNIWTQTPMDTGWVSWENEGRDGVDTSHQRVLDYKKQKQTNKQKKNKLETEGDTRSKFFLITLSRNQPYYSLDLRILTSWTINCCCLSHSIGGILQHLSNNTLCFLFL